MAAALARDGYFAAVALQSHDANYARGGAKAVRRGRGGGDLASLWRLAGGRSPQRTFGFGCARVTYMLLKIHVNAGISRLILHTFDKCVCRGRQSCSRGQLSALAVATCATCAGSRGRAQRLLRVRHAPGAPALESGRRGHVRYICYTADVRHARRLSRARGDRYASDARHARRLSRAGGVVRSVTSPTRATRDGSQGRAATVTRPTRATRDGSRGRAGWPTWATSRCSRPPSAERGFRAAKATCPRGEPRVAHEGRVTEKD